MAIRQISSRCLALIFFRRVQKQPLNYLESLPFLLRHLAAILLLKLALELI